MMPDLPFDLEPDLPILVILGRRQPDRNGREPWLELPDRQLDALAQLLLGTIAQQIPARAIGQAEIRIAVCDRLQMGGPAEMALPCAEQELQVALDRGAQVSNGDARVVAPAAR